LILKALQRLHPEFGSLTLKDIEWKYNFFRKKLLEGFKVEPILIKSDSSASSFNEIHPDFVRRTIPGGVRSKILLDAERYIAKKTTRALFWDAAASGKEIESPHALAELLTNMRLGSPTAKARWVKLQSLILEKAQLSKFYEQRLGYDSNFLTHQKSVLDAQLPRLTEEAIKHLRKQQKALDLWRSNTGALDKFEDRQEKLDDLILKNDRAGLRKMLEAYLPWAVMEPVEANTWRIWLDHRNSRSNQNDSSFQRIKVRY
jgi:hypothetical protein